MNTPRYLYILVKRCPQISYTVDKHSRLPAVRRALDVFTSVVCCAPWERL